MNWRKAEETVDITHRLHHITQLEGAALPGPRVPDEGAMAQFLPLLEVDRHEGRMYVAGHEPHFRTVTLLQPVRQRRSGAVRD